MSKPVKTKIANAIQQNITVIGGCSLVLLASLMTGCGGGGGGSSSSSPSSSSGETSNTPPDSGSSATGNRVSRILYDLDNNGIYEGERSFSYDSDGRVVAENYTYHDDSVTDTNFDGFSIGAPNYNETTAYSYDSDGLVSLWTVTDPTGHTEISYNYGTDKLIDTELLRFFDNGGALLQSISYELINTNNQLTHWDSHMSSSGSLFQSDDLTHDPSGRVQMDVLTQGIKQTESTYTYSASGKILNLNRVSSAYHSDIDFEYDSDNRLTARISRSDEKNNAYRWSYAYDGSGRQSEWLIDKLDDGSTEAAVRYEYEDGPCATVFIWAPRSEPNFVVSTTVPYAPGSGYAQIPVCVTQ